ncbi:MAG TPA: aspartate-semialdehyde dehydrogenase [Thermomicrobiales bacterium]|nr:aspartate-semialdehyde dehydrogenase [Thermomicrobiales bacterium]
MAVQKVPVAVLGATGSVGQRFIQLLANHPWFEVAELVASDRSTGKRYAEATEWRLDSDMPEVAAGLVVKDYGDVLNSPVAFSALPGEVAGEIEQRLAKAGHAVLSNSSTHRMEPDVPLVIAEVNPEHLAAIATQKANRGWDGYIVTNGNCSAIHLVLTLKPLQDAFGLDAVLVTTMQAVSGAGYPGVPSLDMIDNVVPFISTEEEKLAEEARKFLGSWGTQFEQADFAVSASCNRVPVRDGHTEAVSVRLRTAASVDEVAEVFRSFRGKPQELQLPSAPARPLVLRSEKNRPQPILDRDAEKGMASTIGRLRECPVLGIKYTLLGHNTIRGAAGASILNAELLHAEGLLPGQISVPELAGTRS